MSCGSQKGVLMLGKIPGLVVALLVAGCSMPGDTEGGAPSPSADPAPATTLKKVGVTIWAFDNPGEIRFEIDLGSRLVTETRTPEATRDTWELDPAAIQTFQTSVASVGLPAWAPRYANPDIMDGGSWTLVLTYADDTAQTVYGENVYRSEEQPPGFGRFADALAALVGKAVL